MPFSSLMNLKTIVHIGPDYQIPGTFGPKILPNTKHICFEPDRKFSEREYAKLDSTLKKQVEMHHTSAINTGLDSNSVDEAHMHNVMGDTRVENKTGLLWEVKRILKPGSYIYVGETYSPYAFENLVLKARAEDFTIDVLVPHPLEHVSPEQVNRFKKMFLENKTNEMYNKNFDEWYPLLDKMGLLFDYRLNEEEENTIRGIRGKSDFYSRGSYLVKLVKAPSGDCL